MSEEAIFHQARARTDPAERAAYLQQACGDDAALRASVEALLRADVGASGFMDGPPPDPDATVDAPIGERPGTVIGPYKLLQEIGEGGMGTVFMAEQTEPVRRMVALKLVRPGMDSRQILARFEAERQALAMMDHPNIAKVLDAGTTPTGRPYFVMELVKGVPITEYCDQNHLSPAQRLELFVPVCQAVQHAHQKGIIHRDLKPSNVLVARYDDRPVPKVIDFGVAKATGHQVHRADAVHAVWPARRHAGVHVPRAGGDQQPWTSTRAATSTHWASSCTSCWPAVRRFPARSWKKPACWRCCG